MSKQFKTGIFNDPADVYNKEPHLRATFVKEMMKTPAHYLAAESSKLRESKAFDEGIAAHSVCLEQSTDSFIRRPDGIDGRTADGKAKLAELKESGKIILDAEVFDSMTARLDAFANCTPAMDLYNNAKIEESHYAQDPVTGLYLKARPDILRTGIVADFKTTASMQRFEKDIWNLGYFIQVGFYSIVLELTIGSEFNSFYFIAQEKKAPYGVQVFSMDRDAVHFSKEKARELLHRIAACKEVDSFPCYPEQIKPVQVPAWVLANEIELESEAV